MMNLKDGYLEVAERSLQSADANLLANMQESVAFYSYHTFESLGGALCSSVGVIYPKGHASKINQFKSTANNGGLKDKIGRDVAVLATLVSSIRNKCLYPEELADGSVTLPKDYIDINDAKDMLRRIKGLHKKVKKQL
jgi:HEPN domain-containing protein